MPPLTLFERQVLAQLHLAGAIKIDTSRDGGFRLKHHEKHPGARLSPIKLELRIPSNGGALTDHIVIGIAHLMRLRTKNLQCDAIAGIPNAGTPFAQALEELLALPRISLFKSVHEDGSRAIKGVEIPPEVLPGAKVLLIDDLITRAQSKIEAIDVLADAGFPVTDVIVFCDREQGGADDLLSRGIHLHSVVTLRQMLEFYRTGNTITEEDEKIVLTYLQSS